MCLNPTIILNPAYAQHRHEFAHLYLDGRILDQPRISDTSYYPVNLPSFSSLNLSVDNLDRFFAVDPDGVITKIFMPVPCNKCMECQASKQSAIRVRMLLEEKCHDCLPVFFTLTYNDDHLPVGGVSQTDVKRFLNRLHLYLGRAGFSTYFRHVVFSEYGSLKGRPHYHGILYGLDWLRYELFPEFFNILEKAWGKGFVRYEQVTGRAFKYVSKYVGKDSFMNEAKGRNPNFWTASRRTGGLGSHIVTDEDFLELCSTPRFPTISIPLDEKVVDITLPAYIRDKILPPLSKYISKQIRDAYVQFRKDLLLVRMASETLFCPRRRVPLESLTDDIKLLCTSGKCTNYDLLCIELFVDREFDFESVARQYDPLLFHYYGGDDYYRASWREVVDGIDWVLVHTRLLANYELLASSLPDIPLILTQLNARRKVSDRFALTVEKYQSELPPPDQRALALWHKSVKEYTQRVLDGQ